MYVSVFLQMMGTVHARISLSEERLKQKRVFDNFKDLLQGEVSNTLLGIVWLPAYHVSLGREAGWLCQNVLRQPRYQAEPQLRSSNLKHYQKG